MAQQYLTTWDATLNTVPAAQRDEARNLAWDLFQTTDLSMPEAAVEAARCIADVLSFAAEWDAAAEPAFTCAWCGGSNHAPSAMQPAFCTECVHAMLQDRGDSRKDMHRAPELPFEPTPAERKAAYYAAQGVAPVPARGGAWLVPSGTRAGIVHLVDRAGRCTCEAGTHGRRCWHVALVAMQTERRAA